MLVKILILALCSLLPFGHLVLANDIKILYIVVPIAFTVKYFSYGVTIDKYWIAFAVVFLFTTLLNTFYHHQIDAYQLKLVGSLFFSAFAAAALTVRPQQSEITFAINSIIFFFLVNTVVSSVIYGQDGDISRISSFTSLGSSEFGLDLLSSNASFNEIGAMTAAAAVLSLIQVSRKGIGPYYKLGQLTTFLILCYGVMLTGSRSSMFSLGAAVVIYMALTKKIGLSAIIFSSGGLALSLTTAGQVMINRISSVLFDAYSPSSISAFERLYTWQDGITVFLNNPIIGVGLGRYQFESPGSFITSESYYIQILAEGGLVCIITFISFVRSLYVRLKRDCSEFPSSTENIKLSIGLGCSILVLLISNISGTNFFDVTVLMQLLMLVQLLKASSNLHNRDKNLNGLIALGQPR